MNRSSVFFVIIGVLLVVGGAVAIARPNLSNEPYSTSTDNTLVTSPTSFDATFPPVTKTPQNRNQDTAQKKDPLSAASPQEGGTMDAHEAVAADPTVTPLPSTSVAPAPSTDTPNTSIAPSASLSIAPTMVHAGSSVLLSWSSQNTNSCKISGTNGDHWDMLTSDGTQSSPIETRTTFTLQCTGGDAGDPMLVTQTASVTLAPSYSNY